MGLFSFLFGKTKTMSRPRKIPMVKWRDGSFPLEVVGESQHQDALVAICGPHSRDGYDVRCQAVLELEPNNPYDPNAVRVSISNRKVGYLARDQAERVGAQMREIGMAVASCQARVRGGWRTNQYDEGNFGVTLAVPARGWIDFGIGSQPTKKRS